MLHDTTAVSFGSCRSVVQRNHWFDRWRFPWRPPGTAPWCACHVTILSRRCFRGELQGPHDLDRFYTVPLLQFDTSKISEFTSWTFVDDGTVCFCATGYHLVRSSGLPPSTQLRANSSTCSWHKEREMHTVLQGLGQCSAPYICRAMAEAYSCAHRQL